MRAIEVRNANSDQVVGYKSSEDYNLDTRGVITRRFAKSSKKARAKDRKIAQKQAQKPQQAAL